MLYYKRELFFIQQLLYHSIQLGILALIDFADDIALLVNQVLGRQEMDSIFVGDVVGLVCCVFRRVNNLIASEYMISYSL